jgi:RimJ/RimL family protein N-acetyltransferase
MSSPRRSSSRCMEHDFTTRLNRPTPRGKLLPPMEITFTRLDDRGRDRAELVEFLTAHEFPFHATRKLSRDVVEGWIDDGRFDGADHASYWIDADVRRIGLVILHDLTDNAPLFDLRLATEHRGKAYGAEVLKALTALVFTTMPAVNRFEGQTREDNIAMRKTFVRAGFAKEAHYREGWPVEGGRPLASVGYSILRRDWQTGRTTPVVWNDLSP